ncbi:diguanylate cyclase [Oscillochloris trichoides DG-6]|uniref:Diguanylate cyclase n=1 Tax=Oscillochloris trichoides DG-6 TaxID=765420 RepID=E1IDS3_9CHLR|nr:GGDEF domain-containing protein [Oscillochloris trichoides]EFO80644.1 diguanylate cyclase [Oscillochloris trichoides DG-6]
MVEHIAQERLQFEQQRRLAYRISGSLGMLLVLYAQVTQLTDTSFNNIERSVFAINHAVLAGFTCWVLWALAKDWLPLEHIERLMLWFLSFQAIGFNSVVPALLGQSLAELVRETAGDDIWFLLVICSLAFHLYSGRWGILVGVGLYLLAFSVAFTLVLIDQRQGSGDPNGIFVIQMYVAASMLLGFLFILARYRDHIQRLQVEYNLLERVAFTDMLTQLPNRSMGHQTLQRQIALCQRNAMPLSVSIWDIDHFKLINDNYGHDVGDQVLRAIATRLVEELRLSDMLVRWGGEEFLLILPNTTLSSALLVIERLRQVLSKQPIINNLSVTASFGVSCYHHSDTLEQLLQRADAAMYLAKAQGRNRVVADPHDLAMCGHKGVNL